jgi:hypothetical protein
MTIVFRLSYFFVQNATEVMQAKPKCTRGRKLICGELLDALLLLQFTDK